MMWRRPSASEMTIGEMRPSSNTSDFVKQEFFRTGDAGAALAGRSTLVDALVLTAYEKCLAPIADIRPAVLAVGGYGRRELFPYSDVDLLLLLPDEKAANAAKENIAHFLQSLWDSGLRVSHSVRTPEECCELHDQNLELNISLLDQRFLAGDHSLYAGLETRLPKFIRGRRDDLVRNLARLGHERHAKYHNTLYHLEPNVKETPGGLRDLQLTRWLRQIDRSMSVTERSPAELRDATDFLSTLRGYLHYHAGRDNNVFSFEAQEWIADQAPHKNAAAWLRDYYRHARTVHRAALRLLESSEAQTSSLFAQFRGWRSRLSNPEFSVIRERVYFRSPQQLEADPDLLLRLFEFVARHGLPLSLEAEQRISSRLPPVGEHFARSRPVWPALNRILSLPHAHLALRAMHEAGVLRALFPEMASIECLVIRDFFHRYTVDEHTLVAIQTLAELRTAKEPWRRPFAEILAEVEQPALVLLALLLHDVGKGTSAEHHVDASVRVADAAMERIQVPVREADMVRFLIRQHLDLSAALRSRDLHDPSTVEWMAHRVETQQRLKSLTLLTYADISAVNPAAMTAWVAEQLWHLYTLTDRELTRELEAERIHISADGSPARAAFLEGFPTRYVRTHSTDEIEAHMRMQEEASASGVALDFKRLTSAYQLTFLTDDRPFLFASVAGTLSSFGMNILKAEAFANRSGTVLDTFTFSDPSRTLELNPSEVDRLRLTIHRVILGKADVKQLLQKRPKPAPPSRDGRVRSSVSFDSEVSGSATLIQIVAQDRPGLLYDLAYAISTEGCNIEVVLIATEAHKAIDVFYVTAAGQKLSAEKQQALSQSLNWVCDR